MYTQEQWIEIQSAYAGDTEEFNGVTLAQIYSQLVLGDKAVNGTNNNKHGRTGCSFQSPSTWTLR